MFQLYLPLGTNAFAVGFKEEEEEDTGVVIQDTLFAE